MSKRWDASRRIDLKYRVTAINVSRKWIEWAEWAGSLCTANSPFPGHVYCRHPVSPDSFAAYDVAWLVVFDAKKS